MKFFLLYHSLSVSGEAFIFCHLHLFPKNAMFILLKQEQPSAYLRSVKMGWLSTLYSGMSQGGYPFQECVR